MNNVNDHLRTIIHVDIDCFYAQVEMIKNPSLMNLPLGIQQKNIVVTSNYVARQYGVQKCMKISDARKICSDLVLVNGEDLHDYRQMSYNVTACLRNYSDLVERLGLDENFLDITHLVKEKLHSNGSINSFGNVFGDTSMLCDCGCTERLKLGSQIAQEIRDRLRNELGLTTCAGIAHNKLIAKIACSKNKPNKQTIVFPNCAYELLLSLESVANIPWLGHVTAQLLAQHNITKVEELQNTSIDLLKTILGCDRAKFVRDLSLGNDLSPVKISGKPQSIGIEDSCKAISIEKEIEEKLRQLLNRLLVLVAEDGRIPKTLKITVRKYDKHNSHLSGRESRQCNISTSLFNNLKMTEVNKNKLISIIMILFKKIVDTKKTFHITLLGLSFTKFVEKPNTNILKKFLSRNIEVQSVTDFANTREECCTPTKVASTSYVLDSPEFELGPIPKRGKFQKLGTKRNLTNDLDDIEAPSKLKRYLENYQEKFKWSYGKTTAKLKIGTNN
ncbi:DNA polymerase iota isoform X2 [Cylas formicarius]|uniref:DNA polymerase iota isoform X2 n=1 Tax=Cylas formicarius TaxID=197179 RepID=UPI0029587C46|nr:DNA polymerase iota isoform X2 [Cylas formicarius]